MENIKTTVIIVNWNGEKFVDNLLGYFYKNHEAEPCDVLVIDNKSTDCSFGKINNHPVKSFQLNANWGFAQANNIGGAIVETENILFMNNDMLPSECFLTAMEAKCTDKFPIVGAKLIFGETKDVEVHDNFKLITTEGKVQHAGIAVHETIGLPYELGRNMSPDDPEVNVGKEVIAVTGACLMIKTKVFSELRGFNTSFINGFEDVDLCWRAREKGYKCWYEPTAEVIHYCSSSKGRFDFERENREMLQSLWSDERLQKIKL